MTVQVIASVERVTHRYGKTFALNDLTLDIPANCMAGLIGPDGVGKSTLLALIAGVRKIQTGKVMALGGDMADEHHRRASYGGIAYMPQGLGRNLYPTLSVFDNIDFFGRLFGQGAAEPRLVPGAMDFDEAHELRSAVREQALLDPVPFVPRRGPPASPRR